ncbi:DinB family protein [Autumnicola musiva]|uniref:DinB family protein n=1 Tax=Autumnicola musiva TaxID=3075589 RepID=A0ABU3D6D7_9FLAO|nr:DinB family protein [Zunongwangia sp. F117]MDT0677097.1 DinB family protein [Zunongwangia sp. F117]
MNTANKPEVWLRGKIPEVPDLLQPAAHALLQAVEDVQKYTEDFSEKKLWIRPAGRASAGFHLQHLTGVLDRMLTYAAGKELTAEQLDYLKNEGMPLDEVNVKLLVNAFQKKVEEAISIFRNIPERVLTEKRGVGRKQLPSSVIGLYFHAAEHSQRHVGQLLVTISVVKID